MARISIMEALSRVLTASKKYTDDSLIFSDGVTLEFDINKADSYEHIVTSKEYGTTTYKIADVDILPNMDEIPLSPYTLTFYDSSKGGIIEVPAYIEKYTDYTGSVQYYINSEDDVYYAKIMILFENYTPGTPYTFTPGVWIYYKNYDGTITYPMSVKIGGIVTVKEELENKADLVNEDELISMLEEVLDMSLID